MISQAEGKIIAGFIEYRNTIRQTKKRTKQKHRYITEDIARILRENGSSLARCTVEDLIGYASYASSGTFTKNSRQTMISNLKALAQYIHRFHHRIENLDLLTHDIKAGSPEKNRKEALTVEEWDRIINLPMSARNRAILALMYDGYHRPGEILLLRWCDLKDTETGTEYEITFKTEKPRIIVQRPGATEILEAWRRECAAELTDEKPIFPAPHGDHYQTITVLAKMFRKLREKTGFQNLKPSVLRTSAITHDVEAGLPIAYICLRAWGEPYNDLINLYTKPDSAKIQRKEHEKAGIRPAIAVLGSSGKFSTREDRITELELQQAETARRQTATELIIAKLTKKRGPGPED